MPKHNKPLSGGNNWNRKPDKIKHNKKPNTNPWSQNYGQDEDNSVYGNTIPSYKYTQPEYISPEDLLSPVNEDGQKLANFASRVAVNPWKRQNTFAPPPSKLSFNDDETEAERRLKWELERRGKVGLSFPVYPQNSPLPQNKSNCNCDKEQENDFLGEYSLPRSRTGLSADNVHAWEKVVWNRNVSHFPPFIQVSVKTCLGVNVIDIIAKTRDDNTIYYAHCDEKREILPNTKWKFDYVKKLDSPFFINNLEDKRYDNLIISVHGGSVYEPDSSGTRVIHSQGAVCIEKRVVNNEVKNYNVSSKALAEYLEKYSSQLFYGGEGRDIKSWEVQVKSERAGAIFKKIFEAAKPNAKILFYSCDISKEGDYFARVIVGFARYIQNFESMTIYLALGETVSYCDPTPEFKDSSDYCYCFPSPSEIIKVTDEKGKVLKGYQWQRVKAVRDKNFVTI